MQTAFLKVVQLPSGAHPGSARSVLKRGRAVRNEGEARGGRPAGGIDMLEGAVSRGRTRHASAPESAGRQSHHPETELRISSARSRATGNQEVGGFPEKHRTNR